jgi:flagellar protein FlaF
MYAAQVEAYRKTQKITMTGREVEASVLTKAALMLKKCQDHWEDSDREIKLDEALKFNQLVWSIFQGELTKPDNPLPKTLRQDILNLSAFVDKRIFEVMAFPERQKLTILININFNIAAGLKSSL